MKTSLALALTRATLILTVFSMVLSADLSAQEDPCERTGRDWDKTVAAALLSSAGSFAGFYAGAWIGYSTGPYDENIGGLFLGGAAGSTLGASLGSMAVNGNVGRSLGGSLAGGILGLAAGVGMSGATNNDLLGWITFSLTQGLVTALVATR